MPEAKKKRRKSQKQRRAMRRYAIVLTALVAVIAVLTGMTIAGRVNRADPLDVQPSDIRDDGSLRVYLKSLARPDALGLTLDGTYTVESDAGFRFARGTELTVAVSESDLLLSVGGLTIDMGPSFTLTRHAAEDGSETNGLYIHESERDALYAGDLKLVNSGQGIDAYLTIPIEDYLYGVVAYEMSDSFPLEALKAQAIAARTYAMRAKWNAGSREYDVVDTTADQVYKGYDPIYTRVIQAVNETRGVVGMANGTFAGCYYTASNGGQVASAKQIWGGSGAEYIEMKDDPYDLENPSSVVKRARVERKIAADSELARALAEAASEQLATMGLSDDYGDIRIDEITSITPADPDCEGSRMYSAMEFKMKLSGRRWQEVAEATPPEATIGEASPAAAAPTPALTTTPIAWDAPAAPTASPEPTKPVPVLGEFEPLADEITVKIRTYGVLETMLNLSINKTDVEIFSVEADDTGFTICSRRFGHGVGMSQRGAQTMAGAYEKTAEDILAFYYPGMALYRIDWQEKALTKIAALPESVGRARAKPTPKPTQAPLPALKSGEWYATVQLETASSSLNVREQPGTTARILGTLSKGDRVIVVRDAGDGWYEIRTVELSGYVKGDYIRKE